MQRAQRDEVSHVASEKSESLRIYDRNTFSQCLDPQGRLSGLSCRLLLFRCRYISFLALPTRILGIPVHHLLSLCRLPSPLVSFWR